MDLVDRVVGSCGASMVQAWLLCPVTAEFVEDILDIAHVGFEIGSKELQCRVSRDILEVVKWNSRLEDTDSNTP